MNLALQEEVRRANLMWLRDYRHREADTLVRPYLNLHSTTPNSWLVTARQALLLSQTTVAARLNVTRATYAGYEVSERAQTISLQTLSAAAETMNCELVYAVRPRNHRPYSEEVWRQLLPQALQVTHHQMRSSLRHEVALYKAVLAIQRRERVIINGVESS